MRISLSILFLVASGIVGCECESDGPNLCTSDDDCSGTDLCIDSLCVSPNEDGGLDGGLDVNRPDASSCTSDDQCGGGVCVEGACCSSTDQVCGTSCCAATETCFANACVTPGGDCRATEDCDPGQYCEPSLGAEGTPDGGVDGGMDGGTNGDAGGNVCLGAAPSPGRCIALPERCVGDPMPGETCIRDCEFRPSNLDLNAVPEWTWGAGNVREFTGSLDVWATPAVGRITDTNCDGVVDDFDPPNIVFVSGDARGTCCSCGNGNALTCKTGVLRVLDGQTGTEVWSLDSAAPESMGFSGLSVAIGDVDSDGDMEIATVTGEGRIALIDHRGQPIAVSDQPIPSWLGDNVTGWGGGLSIADMDLDGSPEIAYGRVVFSTDGATVTRRWVGTGSWGRSFTHAVSVFVNLDADPELELLTGRTAYDPDGSIKWQNTNIPAGFSAPANFDADPAPEIALVSAGRIHLLDPETGAEVVTSIASPPAQGGNNSGGPPTIADFDGDGMPEIGVAFADNYVVVQVNAAGDALEQLWATPSHDFSSSVTGSTVFDFQGDGAAEVIYNDECFLWVYDGQTGAVRFATPTTSFTATEASLVADVDADGSAEIVMISNGASPSNWNCDRTARGVDWTQPAPMGAADFGRPGWVGSDGVGAGGTAYRGLTVFRAADNSWVGTRTLWNQHAYSVSNVCGGRGDACTAPATYGQIPMNQVDNWSVGFLNNFRQNIQGEGIFDAPDATVTLEVTCNTPARLRIGVRNLGAAVLPAGVDAAAYVLEGGAERELGRGTTTGPLFPGQVEIIELTAPSDVTAAGNTFRARIIVDPMMPTFQECRPDNNQSEDVMPRCLQ
ncbi:MAG: FG-GAP-like repeat-containing protein [Myxococcota bacterium]